MEVWNPRLQKKIRMARPMRLFGNDREVIDEAYPGDVVGLINPGQFKIGDTISEATETFTVSTPATARAARSISAASCAQSMPITR